MNSVSKISILKPFAQKENFSHTFEEKNGKNQTYHAFKHFFPFLFFEMVEILPLIEKFTYRFQTRQF